MSAPSPHPPSPPMAKNWVMVALAAALAFGLQLADPPEGLSPAAWVVVSLGAAMVVLWVSEAIPVAATALLPLVVLPLAGVTPFRQAALPYADPILFLFIGGFVLAAGVERWGLHTRIALTIATRAGPSPRRLVAGFMIAAALLSMWISNTATTLMLAPIALGVVSAVAGDERARLALGGALLLGVAHAATIGGVGTPVGSPTNLIAMGFFERSGEPVSFLQWMSLAAPMVLVMLPIAWLVLTWPLRKTPMTGAAGASVVGEALAGLGRMSPAEWRIAAVFLTVALAWMLRPMIVEATGLSGLTDSVIALAGALSLFIIPAGGRGGGALMDWASAERIPWGIVLLFGGGLALAAAMEASGLSQWIGAQLSGLGAAPTLVLIGVLVIVTILVSELASNVATLTSMLPIIAAVAAATGSDLQALAFPAAIAASFAFMLPIATAPNAIAYGSGVVTLRRMLAAGAVLNLAAVGVILTIAASVAQ